ncbi:hypothetical protein ACI65C_006951 [Semiaphis heraclei]
MNDQQVDRPLHLLDHDYFLPVIYPDIVDEVETMLSGGESDNDDYDVFSDRENEVCHRKNNDWPFCSATASINLENPGYLTLSKRHNHGPEVINKPVSFFREAVLKRVLAPGNLSSSVRLVYNQEIVKFFQREWPLIVDGVRVGIVFANLEAISKYREELGTVEVAGIDGTFKTLPKSPPELKKGAFVTFQIIYKSVAVIRYSKLKLNSVYHLFQTNPVAARVLRMVLAIPHLPAERGNPDGFRAIMNYVQQFPDIEQQLRPFLVGYIERYWLTQVGTRILSVFGCGYHVISLYMFDANVKTPKYMGFYT